MNFNIDEILNKLNRPFVSEDDFKFELAWTVKDIERLERTKKLLKNTNIKFLEEYSIIITNDSKCLTNTYNP